MERGGGSQGWWKRSTSQENLVAMAQQTNKTTKSLDELEEQAEETGNALMRGSRRLSKALVIWLWSFIGPRQRLSEFSM